jgi:hypothetical protein
MSAASTISTEILPPAWNAAVRAIERIGVQGPFCAFPAGHGRWQYSAGNALTTAGVTAVRGIDSLGWTPAETLETYLRLRPFAEDWDAPGMEAYDAL